MSGDFALFGRDLFDNVVTPVRSGLVAERFLFPPFSVLDARSGEWQDRKDAWFSMGLSSELGRSENLGRFNATTSLGEKDTSIFDPVLCELIYRWFSGADAQIVDPFAGGSVRGIVAGSLGRKYWGCDLRAEQIAANEQQADDINPIQRPVWVAGDSRERLADAPPSDLVFSCPPYGDLERYSDDPSDLSAMPWDAFIPAYLDIVVAACARLKQNRFACFVVGDFRDAKGIYRTFPGVTVEAFAAAGLRLYNEAVLVTAVGSGSMRVSKQFSAGRKFVKTHQNVLVFVKGDPKQAAEQCGLVDGGW